ncbi:MAG TPA: hypothetical protein VKU00_28090 [Chthonomonadaceae bacterium]|nr:hypothetical protein [Chthonomonadaceae bacterium]
MAQRAGRVTCPKCGANNFDTVTSCWKCGTQIGAGGTVMAAAPMPVVSAPSYVERAPQSPPPLSYAPVAQAATPTGDSRVARRAAIALALTIPWIGLPVGWIFMMIEDSRKQSIGRVCANWSLVALIPHIALMVWMTMATASFMETFVKPFLTGYMRGISGGRGAEGSDGTSLPNGVGLPRGSSEP